MGCFKMKQNANQKNCQCGLFLSNALLGIHSGSNEDALVYMIRPHMFFFDLDLPGL